MAEPTTNAAIRDQYESGNALNEHDGADHALGFIPTVADTASEPAAADLSGGEVWFNVDTGEFRGYNGTSIGTIGFTADGA